MANDPDDGREQGIEFGTLTDDLEDDSYPLAHGTVIDRYGDHELGLGDERVPLREILASGQDRQYEDAEGVRQAVFNMVGDEAVGREDYSDRGGTGPDTADSTEAESL